MTRPPTSPARRLAIAVAAACLGVVVAAPPPVAAARPQEGDAASSSFDVEAIRAAPPADRARLAGRMIELSRGDVEREAALSALLGDDDLSLRRAVWGELAATVSPPAWSIDLAVTNLRQLAESPDADAQVAAHVASVLSADAIAAGANAASLAALREVALSPSASQAARRASIAALGRVPWRPAMSTLAALLAPTRPAADRRMGAAALAELTGTLRAADDINGSLALAQERLALDELAFAEAAAGDAARVALRQSRAARSAGGSVARLAQSQYAAAAAGDRPAVLATMLASDSPEIRAAAAGIAVDEAGFGTAVGTPVARLLREAVSDASPRVRTLAARHARLRNDAAAAPLLVAQLGRESSAAARLEQVEALVPMRYVAAIPALLALLDDPSPGVRRRAAAVASEFARAPDSAQASARMPDVVAALRGAWTASRVPDDRQAFLDALAPLRDPSLGEFWAEMLRPRDGELPPARVREAALVGLAAQRDARRVEFAVASLGDPDPAVRRAAVTAVGTLGGFGRAPQLERAWDPAREPDAGVRQAAWQAFSRLLPAASTEQLAPLADRFSEPEKKLAVLAELARRAERSGDAELLADRRHQMADVLAAIPARLREAAELYEQALQQEFERLGPWGESPIASARARGALTAYLVAGALDEAERLSGPILSRGPNFQRDVGQSVLAAASAQRDAGNRAAAEAIAADALTWTPPLEDFYQRQLERFRRELR